MKIHAAAVAVLSLSTTFASAKKHDAHRNLDAVMKRLDSLEAENKALHAANKAQDAEIASLKSKAAAAPQAGGNLRRRQLAEDLEAEPQAIISGALLSQLAGVAKCVAYDPYYYGSDDACIFGSDSVDYSILKAYEDVKIKANDDVEIHADADNYYSGDVIVNADSIDVSANGNNGGGTFSVSASDDINLSASDDINVMASSSIDVEADEDISLDANFDGYGTSDSIDIDAGSSGDLSLDAGSSIDLDADEDIDISASDSVDIEAEDDISLSADSDNNGSGDVAIEGQDLGISMSEDVQINADGYGGVVVNAAYGSIDLYSGKGDITIAADSGDVEIAASGVVNSNGNVDPDEPTSVASAVMEGMSMPNIEDEEESIDDEPSSSIDE